MAKFKNVSPLGALDIPALGQIVEAGEVFEVPDDLVAALADQTENFEAVRAEPKAPKAPKGKPGVAEDPGDTTQASVVPSGDDDTSAPAEGDPVKEGDR